MHLTQREARRADLIAHGLSDKDIAIQMGNTRSSTKIMNQQLFRKLGVRGRFEVAPRIRQLLSEELRNYESSLALPAGAD